MEFVLFREGKNRTVDALKANETDSVKKYFEAGIFPQKITENLKDGFTWKKLSSEEKQKLKKIISKF
jgi:hypothetical protein